ncbi:hypothetical protein GXM_03840 [Nostoc sphaeroides CCNUC1]|uniref:Uncharacterized protein n=1 Tax=Nostoc sphaeroides CCNUC1 TaxID=2653204 RepID=A0A5P8W2W3_9NOSO|nr:hypothetical protein GXM_03840 [Nostoc sphaeroides CCNUC1]
MSIGECLVIYVLTTIAFCAIIGDIGIMGYVQGWGKRNEPPRRQGRQGRKEKNTCDTKFL